MATEDLQLSDGRRSRAWRYPVTPVRDVRTGASSRTTLDKATEENFPVAPFFLPRAWRDDLMAVYGYARLVDDIGDGDLAPGGADARHLGLDPADARTTASRCSTPSRPICAASSTGPRTTRC